MHSFRLSITLSCAGLPIFACTIAAQTAQSAAASSTAPKITVLHSTTNLVLVDVVATDHGKPVLDIAQSRFHVFEDGKERPIASFDQHRPSPAPASAASIEAQIASFPAHTYTNLPIYPDTGVLNVLLLDALNTPVKDQAEARREMIEYMGNIPRAHPWRSSRWPRTCNLWKDSRRTPRA